MEMTKVKTDNVAENIRGNIVNSITNEIYGAMYGTPNCVFEGRQKTIEENTIRHKITDFLSETGWQFGSGVFYRTELSNEETKIVKYHGKFTKRLQKFVYKQFGIKISQEVLSKFGQLLKESEEISENWIKTTDYCFWGDGDFADDGSCYWAEYMGHRIAIDSDDRSGAILLYEDSSREYSGIGRAWYYYEEDLDGYFIFNGTHQEEISNPTRFIANMFKEVMGFEYFGNVDISSDIHINETCVFYVGNKKPETAKEYVFFLNPPDTKPCNYCADTFIEDDLHDIDGSLYCDYCRDEYTVECHLCSNEFFIDDMQEEHGYGICKSCHDDLESCDHCGDKIFYQKHEHNGNKYCDPCYDSFTCCDECGDPMPDDTCECEESE